MTREVRSRRISGTCDACGKWAPALDRDHIVPLSWGGKHDRSNIQWLCLPCHKAKTAHERRTGPPRLRKRKRGGCGRVVLWIVVVFAVLLVLASIG